MNIENKEELAKKLATQLVLELTAANVRVNENTEKAFYYKFSASDNPEIAYKEAREELFQQLGRELLNEVRIEEGTRTIAGFVLFFVILLTLNGLSQLNPASTNNTSSENSSSQIYRDSF